MKTISLALALAGVATDPDTLLMTVDLSDYTVGEVLDQLRDLSGVPIEMDEAAKKKVDLTTKATFKVKDVSLTSAVKLLFTGKGVEVSSVDKKKIVITASK
jgi:hypothetical protein